MPKKANAHPQGANERLLNPGWVMGARGFARGGLLLQAPFELGCLGVDHGVFVEGELAEVYARELDTQLATLDVFETDRHDALDGRAAPYRTRPTDADRFHVDERPVTGHLAVVQKDVPGVLAGVPFKRQRAVCLELLGDIPHVVGHEQRVDDVVEAVAVVGLRAYHKGVTPVGRHQQPIDFGVEAFRVRLPVAEHGQATLFVWHRASLLL